ncbi:MAG: NADH-quinone oxidoreductase subunit C [Cystobacterineae bacterium]|nr:NADH-quinone oxidoreductase subunit C [Cystobacterineae bacterium]
MSQKALDSVQHTLPQALVERYEDITGAHWGIVNQEFLLPLLRYAKETLGFRLFISMDAVDRLQLPIHKPRFEVLYFLYSPAEKAHLRLKVLVEEQTPTLPSAHSVFQGALWAERSVWDFYGIRFEGHPDLRRMFLYEAFEGHPLRKDYPLRGRQPLIPENPVLENPSKGPGNNCPV